MTSCNFKSEASNGRNIEHRFFHLRNFHFPIIWNPIHQNEDISHCLDFSFPSVCSRCPSRSKFSIEICDILHGFSPMFTSIFPFMLINCILTFLEERLLSSLFGWRNCIFSRFCNFATFFFADSTFSQLKRGCYPFGMPFVLHQRRHYQSGFTRCQYSTGNSTQIPTYPKDPFFVQKIKSYQNFQNVNKQITIFSWFFS